MTERKYIYWRILQSNHGYGWDDVEFYDSHDSTVQERKQALKEYRQNQPNAKHRFINRKELKKNAP